LGGRKRTFGDRLSHAFFRWESAVTIALAIILVFFSLLFRWEYWYLLLALGLVAEALIVVSSLSDRGAREPAPAFDVDTLQDPRLRQQVEKALEVRQRMEDVVQGSGDRALRDATAGLNEWVEGIVAVAHRLDVRKVVGPAQLENTLAALGWVYIQLQLVGASEVDNSWIQHLRQDIAGQVASLQGVAEHMG